MSYADENIEQASQVLGRIVAALRAVSGAGTGETGSERAAHDPITSGLADLDWFESIVNQTVMHIDYVATTAAGAGAVANTDKAVTELEHVLQAAESGWFGAAASQFTTFAGAVKRDLENFKDELEQWSKDVAADPVEQAESATQALKAITRKLLKEADGLAARHNGAADRVLAGPAGSTDPEVVAATNEIELAGAEFDAVVKRLVASIGQTVFPLSSRHAGYVVDLADPHHAIPVLIQPGFSVSIPALNAALMHAEISLAMLRDARNNIEAAQAGPMPFGTSAPAMDTAAAWVTAAAHRLDDLKRLMTYVEEIVNGLTYTRAYYEDNEARQGDDMKNILDGDFMRKLLSDDPRVREPVELLDPLEANNGDTVINDILNSGWEGRGRLPDVPLRGPVRIGEGVPDEEE
jgi:predicted HD phosphohydrolase